MTSSSTEFVEALEILLHGQRIAVQTHYSGGKNLLAFDPDYSDPFRDSRATFTLTQRSNKIYLSQPRVHRFRLAPVLSNLLPEGALREWMTQSLKVHLDNEFALLAFAGSNLPGALIARPLLSETIPAWALSSGDRIEAIPLTSGLKQTHFSLAGVQMKFSSAYRDGRYLIGSSAKNGDDWIIKTPSTIHPFVPENEYSVMKLAEAVGIDIPQIKLIPLKDINKLPDIRLPDESWAYGIKRFDRSSEGRIHTEDFAQIFELYAHDKYGKVNYEQIGRVVYQYSENGLADLQQMARRLLVNVLLANGDAHIKNWSVIYPDRIHPRLAPAYDIVSTLPYISGEDKAALNMARQKEWYRMTLEHFKIWTQRIGAPWPAVRVHLEDVLEKARDNWPTLLETLPMNEVQKNILSNHWEKLEPVFRIK